MNDPRDEQYLAGITVLDLTQYLSGPSCTRLLREMGADVIKVEQPPHGDPSRSFEPRLNRRAGFHVQQNRGKRSVAIDLSSDEGRDLVRSIAEEVDILVENFSPGVMARKGLDHESLSAKNPGLIMVSISGFGQTGPLADRPAFDFIAQAYSGLMHMTGFPDGPPVFVGMAIADTVVGVHAFGAIGHALFRRTRTGVGMHIDCSMVDALVHMHETAIYAPSMTDGAFVPMRAGRHYQPSSPGGVFRGPQGWIVVFCTQGQIAGLWRALGRPELATDKRFVNNLGRLQHRGELTELIETWMATFATDDEVVAALHAERVPVSKVMDPADLASEPHLRVRDMIREVEDPRLGSVTVPGFPIQFSDGSRPPDGEAPNLGQHNREILSALLGKTDDEIDGLLERGVIGEKDR